MDTISHLQCCFHLALLELLATGDHSHTVTASSRDCSDHSTTSDRSESLHNK